MQDSDPISSPNPPDDTGGILPGGEKATPCARQVIEHDPAENHAGAQSAARHNCGRGSGKGVRGILNRTPMQLLLMVALCMVPSEALRGVGTSLTKACRVTFQERTLGVRWEHSPVAAYVRHDTTLRGQAAAAGDHSAPLCGRGAPFGNHDAFMGGIDSALPTVGCDYIGRAMNGGGSSARSFAALAVWNLTGKTRIAELGARSWTGMTRESGCRPRCAKLDKQDSDCRFDRRW